MRRCRWGTLDCVSGDALAPGPLASARLPAVFRKLSGGSGIAGLGKCAQRQTPHPRFICCPGAVSPAPLSALSQRLPSALQVLCVFMKLRAQLHRWPPLVLLQSCEQVPKRRHSLMSRGYTPGSGRVSRRGASARLLDSPFLPWHPGWPGTVWKPVRQAQ